MLAAVADYNAVRIRDALAARNLPVFVARLGAQAVPVLEVGTLANASPAAMRRDIEECVRQLDIPVTVKIARHRSAKLSKKRSLEALIAATGDGVLVLDRTLALGRAEALVDLARELRRVLGSSIYGVFFQSDRRTLFVVLSPASRTRMNDVQQRSEMMAQIAATEMTWRAARGHDAFEVAVRVGFNLPSGIEVIAVDRKTVSAAMLRMLSRPIRSRVGLAILGSIVGASISIPAMAADLPAPAAPAVFPTASDVAAAVDAPNFSVSALSGVARDPVDFDHLWAGLSAKGDIPLGQQFGAQLDVGIATDSYYGAALHLFARNPDQGLIGLVGSTENQYGVSMNRIGAEAEYYLSDNFTVSARAGYQGGTTANGGFGRLDLKFYPDPDLVLTAGAEAQPSFNLGRVGVEWRPAASGLAGMSVSADASVASTGDYRATFGLHFQLGGSGSQTLLDRDRRSDPASAIFNQFDVSSAVPSHGYAGPPT